MAADDGRRRTSLRFAGSLWIAVSVLYSLFALAEAFAAIVALLTERDPERAVPPLFVVHAVTGSVALVVIAVQLRLAVPPGSARRRLHRGLGLTYVAAAVVTNVLSLGVVAGFRVDVLTKVFFLGEAVLWLVTTLVAYRHIRRGRVAEHRRWMIRSFALAAFFVSFGLWHPLMAAGPLPASTGYALAVLLAWAGNLLAAEIWIRVEGRKRERDLPVAAT